jgi:hypothetical protein
MYFNFSNLLVEKRIITYLSQLLCNFSVQICHYLPNVTNKQRVCSMLPLGNSPAFEVYMPTFRNTELNMTTLLNCRTHNSSLPKPKTWINSSGKPLNLKCTHITSTEKMA